MREEGQDIGRPGLPSRATGQLALDLALALALALAGTTNVSTVVEERVRSVRAEGNGLATLLAYNVDHSPFFDSRLWLIDLSRSLPFFVPRFGHGMYDEGKTDYSGLKDC